MPAWATPELWLVWCMPGARSRSSTTTRRPGWRRPSSRATASPSMPAPTTAMSASATRPLAPAMDHGAVDHGQHHGHVRQLVRRAVDRVRRQAREVCAQSGRDAAGEALLADDPSRVGGVALQRLDRAQRRSLRERRALLVAGGAAEAGPGHPQARVSARDRPVRAEREDRAAAPDVAPPEPGRGLLRPEVVAPVERPGLVESGRVE